MREIKFRVWDKRALAMSPVFVLFGEFTLLGAVHDWQRDKLKDVSDQERYDSLGRLNDLEILQSTGLYDKNGKERFEGYVIRRNTGYVFIERLRIYSIGEASMSGYEYHSDDEIIGNIFENPELLNP